MNSNYTELSLGEILRRVERFESRDELKEYQFAGTFSFARGIFIGERRFGATFKLPKIQRIHSGDFVYCKIMAWEGAFGVVPEAAHECVLSGAFVVYEIDQSKIDRNYLAYYFKVPSVWKSIGKQSTGTNVRRQSLHPSQFEAAKIPLPPLLEQQRIVARIEDLAAKIKEARRLRQETLEETDHILIAMAHRADLDKETKLKEGWKEVAIHEIVKQVHDAHPVRSDVSYPNFGIYSFGRGLFIKPPIDGLTTSAKILYRVRKGQFIYSRLFAFEGSYGMVSDEYDGCFISGEYPTFECNKDLVNAEFLYSYFKAPHVWSQVAAGSKGLGDRRQRVQPERILAYRLMLPPMEWQRQIALVKSKFDVLKPYQEETAAELEALLPSILDKAFKANL